MQPAAAGMAGRKQVPNFMSILQVLTYPRSYIQLWRIDHNDEEFTNSMQDSSGLYSGETIVSN